VSHDIRSPKPDCVRFIVPVIASAGRQTCRRRKSPADSMGWVGVLDAKDGCMANKFLSPLAFSTTVPLFYSSSHERCTSCKFPCYSWCKLLLALWPLFHYLLWQMFHPPRHQHPFLRTLIGFRMNQANAAFARRILDIYQPGDLVWIHDYHLFACPKLVALDWSQIYLSVFLLHTPWPSSEVFRCVPREYTSFQSVYARHAHAHVHDG